MVGVIFTVPYTEIDWEAYMEEVNGFLSGEFDYRQLKGGTGPLVYPGGFVWLFSALYYLTAQGTLLAVAQGVFLGVYILTWGLALRFYAELDLVRAGLLISLFTSRRIRSLYVLRLFNDCWAMLFVYVGMWYLATNQRKLRRWLIGCAWYSLAVSVKMNIFLFAPGLLYAMLRCLALWEVAACLTVCLLVQLAVAFPFLLVSPGGYLAKAFELSRVFTYKWSVNFQYLPESVFLRPELGIALLAATLCLWALAFQLRWRRRRFGAATTATAAAAAVAESQAQAGTVTDGEAQEEDPEDEMFRSIVLTMLESNLIGVLLSRSLHYQFFTWFFHTTPLVLAYTRYPLVAQVLIAAGMRVAFEKYPPTSRNSLLFAFCGLCALFGIIFRGVKDEGAVGKKAATAGNKKKVGEELAKKNQ